MKDTKIWTPHCISCTASERGQIFVLIFLGCQSQSVNCGATTNAGNVVSTVGCREAPQPPSDDDGGFISSNTMYLVVIVFGLVAIPATAIVRICWTRRLYGRGRRLPNRDGNHPSRQCPNGRGDLFTIDIGKSFWNKIIIALLSLHWNKLYVSRSMS